MNKWLIVLPLVAMSFIYGIAVGHYEIFPFENLKQFKFFIVTEHNNYGVYDDEYKPVIRIENNTDVVEKRSNLIKYIWKNNGFPTSDSPELEQNFSDQRFFQIKNLERIDKITVNMNYQVNSIVYHFIPKTTSNNKLIIYIQGHDGDFVKGIDVINHFLDRGYSIAAFSMPLLGQNSQPTVELTDIGKIKLVSHNQLRFLESDSFSPISYFMEPITISLNYFEKNYSYDNYSVIGISGGGWTAELYSAVDERISETISIAGSIPLELRTNSNDVGDYEQNLPQLHKIVNYPELYLIDSVGNNRKFIQIFNKNDPCCFSGKPFEMYEELINKKLLKLGSGKFIPNMIEHDKHEVSTKAMELILNELEN